MEGDPTRPASEAPDAPDPDAARDARGGAGGAAAQPPDARPEDRPIDPEAVARFERLPAPDTAGGAVRARPLLAPRPVRNNLVTTAGGILVALGLAVGVAAVGLIAPSDGLDVSGIELSSAAATGVFLGLGVVYALVGVLVLLRIPAARPLGIVVGVLALVVGFAQLGSAGANGIPTVVVAAFIVYALGVGGSDFRRG
jgi:hypothetical protein